jgi:DNA-binding response OmpR family regulator
VEGISIEETSELARILVVEDDRASRMAMLALLRMSGFEALPAASVAEGMGLLAQNPSCIILDLMLPDGNGAEILAYVRDRRLPMRIVVTTGAIEWRKMLNISPTPPDLVLQKPVDFRQMLRWLQSHCRDSSSSTGA